jgi:hypothetical protein
MLSTETHFKFKGSFKFNKYVESKRMQIDISSKRTLTVMLIPNKMNFKTNLVTRDKNGYCVMIK